MKNTHLFKALHRLAALLLFICTISGTAAVVYSNTQPDADSGISLLAINEDEEADKVLTY